MRIALIPPTPELPEMPLTGIHLILSHLLEDDRYASFYTTRALHGDYVILDNSAHEYGAGNKAEQLLAQCAAVFADEVVAPDVLFDANATVEASRSMFRYIDTHWEQYLIANKPRLMLVPQGTNRGEWVKSLHGLLRAWDVVLGSRDMEDPVIGVSKDYDSIVKGGITTLIKQYLEPMKAEVHCLGWPTNLWSLAKVMQECPWVRSTDSAKPYVYAANEILLEPGGSVPEYPRRAPDYFTKPLTDKQRKIATRNVKVFQAAALDMLILA